MPISVGWKEPTGTASSSPRRLGRVTINPVKHVDPVGTIVLPALLLLLRAPFLFGWAKPVPVAFHRLNNPKRDMVWVALAGPGVNIAMALAAALLLHLVRGGPSSLALWIEDNLIAAIEINVVLAVHEFSATYASQTVAFFDAHRSPTPRADVSPRWARTLSGPTNEDEFDGVAAAPDGSVYATGKFERTATLGGASLSSAGRADIPLARFVGTVAFGSATLTSSGRSDCVIAAFRHSPKRVHSICSYRSTTTTSPASTAPNTS